MSRWRIKSGLGVSDQLSQLAPLPCFGHFTIIYTNHNQKIFSTTNKKVGDK